MSTNLSRTEIHDLLTKMAALLEGDRQVSPWHAFLLKAADIALDPMLDDDEDTVNEIADALRAYYNRNSRLITDSVIHRPDTDDMRAASERLGALQDTLFNGLPG